MATKKARSDWRKPEIILGAIGIVLSFMGTLIAIWAVELSSKSTDAALNALELQKQESVEAREQDEIDYQRDTAQFNQSLRLSQEQIEALKQQVSVLQYSSKIETQSKRPVMDVMQFGFHVVDDKNTSMLKFKVRNLGTRQALLTGVGIAILDTEFKCILTHFEKANTILINEKTFESHLILPIEGKVRPYWSFEELKKFPPIFVCISTRYQDTFMDKPQQKNELFFQRWLPEESIQTMSNNNGLKYFGFDLCSAPEEISISKSLTKQEKWQIINPKK